MRGASRRPGLCWMTDDPLRRALVGRGSVFLAGRVAIVATQVIALPFVTRALSPSEYGTVAIALLASAILASAGDAGLPLAASRVYFDGSHGASRARVLVGIAACFGLAVALVADFTGDSWAGLFGSLDYGQVLRLGVWMTAPAIVRAASMSLLRAQDRPYAHSVVAVISAAGGQSLGLVLLLGLERGPEGYLSGILLGSTLSAIVGFRLVGGKLPSRSAWAGLRRVFSFSLPTVPGNVSRSVLDNGDRFIIERLVGLTGVGRYQVAYRVGSLATMVASELGNALVPLLFDQGRDDSTFRHIYAKLSRLSAGMALGLASFGPIALAWITPDSYSPERLAPVVGVVAATAIPHAVGVVAKLGLVRHKNTRGMAYITVFSAGANLTLAIAGVALLGLLGAALATLAAISIEASLLLRVFGATAGRGHFSRDSVLVASAGVAACGLVAGVPTGQLIWDLARTSCALAAAGWLLWELRK